MVDKYGFRGIKRIFLIKITKKKIISWGRHGWIKNNFIKKVN